MPNLIEITEFSAPELDVYARLSEVQLRSRQDPSQALFIAESPLVIGRALDAGCVPVSALMDGSHVSAAAREILARLGADVPVFTAEDAVLTQLTGFHLTRGMLCAMRRPALPTVELLPAPEVVKFTFQMTEEERRREAERQSGLLEAAFRAAEGAGLLVLDELCAALSAGMVALPRLLELLDSRPEGLEVVITGRDPSPELLERAGYITEMVKRRHPFDRGVQAREGVEW